MFLTSHHDHMQKFKSFRRFFSLSKPHILFRWKIRSFVSFSNSKRFRLSRWPHAPLPISPRHREVWVKIQNLKPVSFSIKGVFICCNQIVGLHSTYKKVNMLCNSSFFSVLAIDTPQARFFSSEARGHYLDFKILICGATSCFSLSNLTLPQIQQPIFARREGAHQQCGLQQIHSRFFGMFLAVGLGVSRCRMRGAWRRTTCGATRPS